MINIKEEIQVLLLRKGLSMRRLIKKMENDGHEMPGIESLSRMLSRKTIRFERVQEILDFLGYELDIKPKNSINKEI
jgi:hypothetical protein